MMASNPMQRKSRNAFLLGIVVTLLISGVIIALLFLQLKQKTEELNAEMAAKVLVYKLTQDVKAGQTLTQDMFELQSIHREAVPSNATATPEVIESWFLQTKDGEAICRDEYGLYLDRAEETEIKVIMEIKQNTDGSYYMDVEGEPKVVTPGNNKVQTDEYGMFYINSQSDNRIRVYKEDATDEYYIYEIDAAGVRTKEYLNIKNVPVLAKIDMNAKTVITPEFVVQSDAIVTDDTRQEEYNMIVLPVDLMTNDYVDIRLMTPAGQNFIVVSKVQVDVPMNADGTYITDTIKVDLREDEILAMSSAIVEAYGLRGAKLYVTKYVDPAMQVAAVPTYTPSAAVTAQIDANGDGKIDNPNIVEAAMKELAARYSDAAKNARNQYLQQLINSTEGYLENIEESVEEEIGNSITARQQYLESLGYGSEEY